MEKTPIPSGLRKNIFVAVSVAFVVVAIYFAIDVMTLTTPPWERKKAAADTLSYQDSIRQTVFADTLMYLYKVRRNDALSNIAEAFNLPADSIRAMNGLQSEQLREGQRLQLRVRALHKVRRNEMLEHIARLYGVESRDLMRANHISRPEQLQFDLLIVIPIPE
jgi:spore germination protein YaaH